MASTHQTHLAIPLGLFDTEYCICSDHYESLSFDTTHANQKHSEAVRISAPLRD
jgi:hypothetical protein